jgi:hypothetical protein
MTLAAALYVGVTILACVYVEPVTIAVRTSLPIVGAVSHPETLLTARTTEKGVAVLKSVIVAGYTLSI